MTVFALALKENLRQRVNLALILALPFPLLLIPANDFGYPFGINLYGLLMFYTAFLLARPLAEDRMKGRIVRIAASPIGILRYLVGHFSAYLTLLGLQVGLFVAGSALVHRLEPRVYLMLTPLYLSFAVMGVAFAVAWNSLFRSYNMSFGLFAGLGSLMCLVSGVSMPLAIIPAEVRRYTMALPTYWLPYGIDALSAQRSPELLLSHAILWAYATAFILAGTRRRL